MGSATPNSTDTINVLLSSFPGLGLPSTLCLPRPSTSTIADLTQDLYSRLPSLQNKRLILTTVANKQLSFTSSQPLSSLLHSRSAPVPALETQDAQPQLLTLRLSAPLCGGKGGFGSQLRAAGGRMSSRKKRTNDAAANGSNRNLDGRRLRTVTEAKALAEYLAMKPEMEKKEKEERRQKWEAIVEASERRQEEILSGKAGRSKGRGDAEWLERKEEAEAKTREAVQKAVREGLLKGSGVSEAGFVDAVMSMHDESADEEEDDGMESSIEEDNGEGPSNSSSKATTPEEAPQRKVFGWDEDDDEEDDDDDDNGHKQS